MRFHNLIMESSADRIRFMTTLLYTKGIRKSSSLGVTLKISKNIRGHLRSILNRDVVGRHHYSALLGHDVCAANDDCELNTERPWA